VFPEVLSDFLHAVRHALSAEQLEVFVYFKHIPSDLEYMLVFSICVLAVLDLSYFRTFIDLRSLTLLLIVDTLN
jgi:hypothetical protein